MERILTIGKVEPSFDLGFDFVQLPRFTNDEDRHDFVLNILNPLGFDKLVILIDGEDGYDGLKIGLHVRLTLDLHRKRLVPILFVSSDPLAVILRDAGVAGRILSTKGCKLEKPDVRAIQSKLAEFATLPIAELGYFLNLIQLSPDETSGRHSLANQWGAYALDKAAGTRALRNNLSLKKAQKQLFFKYVQALNYDSEKLNRPTTTIIELDKPSTERIKADGKKILLIDDETDKGWSDVLRVLFKTANPNSDFQVIDRKLNRWDSFSDDEKKLIAETGFDLFLIDLRLSGSDEEDMAKPENFSGTDVMRQIKLHNNGNQVIMFTASNKAWNLKSLLGYGADGYYIKESPEYNFSESFSEGNFRNFKKEAEICLEKSYLRKAFSTINSIQQLLNSNGLKRLNLPAAFRIFLDQGFNTLYQATASKQEFYLYAFLDFYKIIELLGKELIWRSTAGYVIKGGRATSYKSIPFIQFNPKIESEISPTVTSVSTHKKPFTYIHSFSVGKFIPISKDEKYYQWPTSSTRFAGLMLLRFGMTETDTVAFLRLNRLRNDLTHEGNTTAKVFPADVIEILQLIERAFKEI